MMGTQQNSHGGAFAITSEMSTLGQTLQSLRQKKGHFEGGEEFIKDVDGFNGEKHRTMKELQKLLGVPGTPAQNVMQVMGKPDEVTRQGAEGFPELMPGPTVPAGAGTTDAGDGLYLIYFWRGRHDYLYFLTDASEKVTKCDWYMAGE
ncbi:hypothetical protein HK101_009747 [Irineochytrium annulatum]|nr:hypothetical protein HK101_009747 [Irineochytrium annulatum]